LHTGDSGSWNSTFLLPVPTYRLNKKRNTSIIIIIDVEPRGHAGTGVVNAPTLSEDRREGGISGIVLKYLPQEPVATRAAADQTPPPEKTTQRLPTPSSRWRPIRPIRVKRNADVVREH
jgi:hypothetical protein